MAIVKSNLILSGISGRVGNIVFRQVRGKTVVAARPSPRKKNSLSESQLKQQNKFSAAALFAKHAMHDPELKMHYGKLAKRMKLTSAYTAALTSYLKENTIII